MWTSVSTVDVLAEFTPAETAILNNIQGVATSLGTILTKTVSRVRSQIKAGGNQLDMTGATVPDALVEEVISIARWRWLNSFPGLASLKTKERKEAHDTALAMMKEISSNKPDRPRTELPAAPDTTAAPVSAVEVARPGTRLRPHGFGKLGST
jgi:hypothetical protein